MAAYAFARNQLGRSVAVQIGPDQRVGLSERRVDVVLFPANRPAVVLGLFEPRQAVIVALAVNDVGVSVPVYIDHQTGRAALAEVESAVEFPGVGERVLFGRFVPPFADHDVLSAVAVDIPERHAVPAALVTADVASSVIAAEAARENLPGHHGSRRVPAVDDDLRNTVAVEILEEVRLVVIAPVDQKMSLPIDAFRQTVGARVLEPEDLFLVPVAGDDVGPAVTVDVVGVIAVVVGELAGSVQVAQRARRKLRAFVPAGPGNHVEVAVVVDVGHRTALVAVHG